MFTRMKGRIHEHQRTGPVDSVLMPLGQMRRYFPARSLFACAAVRGVRTIIHTRHDTGAGGSSRRITMTHRKEIEDLAAKLGAEVIIGADGRIARVYYGFRSYGDGAMTGSLLCFAERARRDVAQMQAEGV